MNYINLIKIATNALMRNKFRSFLTMLGVIIGVGSVIAMLAIGQGSKQSITDQISEMGSNLVFVMPGSMQSGGVRQGGANNKSLDLDDVEAIINSCPSVSVASPEVRGSGQAVFGNANWPTSLFGTNIDYLEIKKLSVESGRMFTGKEIKSASKVCLIGKTVQEELFGLNSDPVGLTIRFKNIPFRIIGVLGEKGDNTFGQDQDDLILAPYTTVQKRILAITHLQAIYTSAIDEESSDLAAEEISSVLRKEHKLKDTEDDDFTVRNQKELVSTFSSISNILTVLLGTIAGISLLIGGIGIMNIMLVSVTERTREIGLRMSIGGKGRDILTQFLIESMLLSVFGGIVGILIGLGGAKIIGMAMDWPLIVTVNSVVVSFAVCTIIGVFFGWYPARKASELDPIDALRYE
jgi:putative ABC transport system permease protein